MKAKLIPILIANLFAATAAVAAQPADDDFRVTGSVSVGGRYTNLQGRTPYGQYGGSNTAKALEYRDLQTGFIGGIELDGYGEKSGYWVNLFGENLGYDDQYIDLKGGKYGDFKYRLYNDKIPHNISSAPMVRTVQPGLPPANPNAWTQFDYTTQRNEIGGMFEASFNSPWYVRVDGSQQTKSGLFPQAASNGTSPGNGFRELATPVDYKTTNWSVEGGYSSKRAQASASFLHSQFTNSTLVLPWANGFFGGLTDASYLPPSNTYWRAALNGSLRQLPLNSTLSGRITYGKLTGDSYNALSALTTGNIYGATNPTTPVFNGESLYRTATLSLASNPARNVDTRLWWDWWQRQNHNTQFEYCVPACGAGLGGPAIENEKLSFRRNIFGLEGSWRINPGNRVAGGIDYTSLAANRTDYSNSDTLRLWGEYKNTMLEDLSGRIRYTYLDRDADFLRSGFATSAVAAEAMQAYVGRMDMQAMTSNQVKLVLDWAPAPGWDLGMEAIWKRNDFKDQVLNRNADTRQELYFNVGYGDPSAWRVMAFADFEWVDMYGVHRNPGTAASPYTPPSAATGYNWSNRNKDTFVMFGIGADAAATDKLTLKGSWTWQQSDGTADFQVQNNLAGTVLPLPYVDAWGRYTVNLRGQYKATKQWTVTGGYVWEKYTYSDTAYDGYRYTIPAAAGATSYFTGAYANPSATMNMLYLTATYKF